MVMSVSNIKSAAQAEKYFLRDGDEYYTREVPEALTEWFGQGATKLGLGTHISSPQFRELLEGRLPNGTTLGKLEEGKLKHRPGIDLTFSAPKSASLLMVLGLDDRLKDAFRESVKVTLREIERATAQTRITEKGNIRFQNTGNLAIALVPHEWSRALDPAYHIHSLVMNMTERSDGKWSSLASLSPQEKFKQGDEINGFYERVRAHAHYFGLMQNAEFAFRVKALGYPIRITNHKYGFWEIDIPALLNNPVLKHFSKRSQQKDDFLDEKGFQGAKASAIATIATRPQKPENMDVKKEIERCLNEWHELGFEPQKFNPADLIKEQDTKLTPELQAQEKATAHTALKDAILHHSTFDIAFSEQKLLTTARRFALGKVSQDTFETTLKDFVKNGALIPLPDSNRFTTKETIQTEKTILSAISQAKNQSMPLLSATEPFFEDKRLSHLQQVALNEILKNKDRVIMLNGVSGTGKTFLIQSLVDVIESKGKTIRLVLPSTLQVSAVRESTQRKNNNLWQWLVNLNRPELGETVAGFIHKLEKDYTQPLGKWLHRHSFVIVDNAHQLGNRDIEKLLTLTTQSNARLLLMGNIEGKASSLAGHPWKILSQHKNIITLNDLSRNPSIKNLTQASTPLSIDVLEKKEIEERLQNLARIYVELNTDEKEKTRVIIPTKRLAQEANVVIRHALKEKGLLAREEMTISTLLPKSLTETERTLAKSYTLGDSVQFFKATPSLLLKKGERATITGIDERSNRIMLKTEMGLSIKWNPKRLFNNTSVASPTLLNISEGEKIRLTQPIKDLKLKKETSLTVESISSRYIKVHDSKGVSYSLERNNPNHQYLSYNYAHNLNQIEKPVDRVVTLLESKSANQRILSELTKRAQSEFIVITESEKTLTQKLAWSTGEKSTALASLLGYRNGEKIYEINAQTSEIIKQDIEKAIATLPSAWLDALSPKSTAEKAVNFALEKITEREAGFLHKTLVGESLKFALSKDNVSLHEIYQVIEDKQKSGELIIGKHFKDGTRWTTRETVGLEESILSLADKNKNNREPLLDKPWVRNHLSSTQLTDGQKEAILLVLTSRDGLNLIQGYAGVGKTTLFKELKNLLENHTSTQIVGLCPTHQSVAELQSVGIQTKTVDSFLVEIAGLERQASSVDLKNTLFILDEASMVANQSFHAIQAFIDKAQGRFIAAGDRAQLLSPSSGKPFELALRHGTGHALMTEIVRQKTPELLNAVKAIIQDNPVEAFKQLETLNPNRFIERENNTLDTLLQNSSIVEITENKKEEQQGPSRLMFALVKDYLSRTPEIRQLTKVIAHANDDRIKLSTLIREGLQAKDELSKEEKSISVLVSKGLTQTEMKHAMYYEMGNTVRFNRTIEALNISKGSYWKVETIDQKQNQITLSDSIGNTIMWNPDKQGAQFKGGIEVYESQERKIAIGDRLRFTRADREQGQLGGDTLKVTDIKNSTISVKNERNQAYVLDTDQFKDTHIDHGYVVTGYGAQGGTWQYVIDYEVSWRKNLANKRSFYIALSRAKTHAMLYTDNKEKLLERIVTNAGDKYMASEIINQFIPPLPSPTFVKKEKQEFDKNTISYKELQTELNQHCESLIENLLGEPNRALSSSKALRFGHKGSLMVNLTGEKRGLWHSFETGESGNLIQLIEKQCGLNPKEATKWAIQYLGLGDNKREINKIGSLTLSKEKTKPVDKEEKSKTLHYAEKLVKESQPIKGTLAERYLNNRGIDSVSSEHLRFHPNVHSKVNNATLPALLVVGTDKENQLQCLQTVFLDKETGRKANVQIQKQTFGKAAGANITVSSPKANRSISFVAEGPETALSINKAFPEFHTIATLGKSNFLHLNPNNLGNKVVLCLDNDGVAMAKSMSKIHEAVEQLQNVGKTVWVTLPSSAKTDFNDVHQNQGLHAVKAMILKNAMMVNSNKLQQVQSLEQIIKQHQARSHIEAKLDSIKIEKIKSLIPKITQDISIQKKESVLQKQASPNSPKTPSKTIQLELTR